MKRRWDFLDRADMPDGHRELRLYQRGDEFSIEVNGTGLMGSELHGSEDALAELACERITDRPGVRVLIGGLGMGFTAAAALRSLADDAEVIVAELVPAVIAWNEGPLADVAGRPLYDPRLAIFEGDVAEMIVSGAEAAGTNTNLMSAEADSDSSSSAEVHEGTAGSDASQTFDAILLDVDNGPRSVIQDSNAWLYSKAGLAAATKSLRPGGILAVWSTSPSRSFSRKLRRAGFAVEEVRVRARGARGGPRHMIWMATPQGAETCVEHGS